MKRLLTILCLAAPAALAQLPAPGPVIASGTMPDQAGKDELLARLRDVYGAGRVVDQIVVGDVAAPAGWSERVAAMVGPALRNISGGQLAVEGSTVSLRGAVPSDAVRGEVASKVAQALGGGFSVSDGLHVAVQEQALLDAALADRIVEFESGRATLTGAGMAVLDQVLAALRQVRGKRVEVIGHTDNAGSRARNLALSQARAEAVKAYVVARGIRPDAISVSGEGPDRPVADNASADGRARNRRIEFKVITEA
jgi:OOP family OmpA-OmpF porin